MGGDDAASKQLGAGWRRCALAGAQIGRRGATVTYTYHALGRLTSAVNPYVKAALYRYDPADNITRKTICGATQILSAGANFGFAERRVHFGHAIA